MIGAQPVDPGQGPKRERARSAKEEKEKRALGWRKRAEEEIKEHPLPRALTHRSTIEGEEGSGGCNGKRKSVRKV